MIHVRVPEKLGKANNTTVEMNHRRERLPGNSLAAFTMHRLVNDPSCSSRTNFRRAEEALDVIAAKLRRKILLMRLIREGRANDRLIYFFRRLIWAAILPEPILPWCASLPIYLIKCANMLLICLKKGAIMDVLIAPAFLHFIM